MGPTGSGKSHLAEALAARLDAVLVNADAFQVYRGFDIGTNKPEARSRYRLLDILDPTEGFGVGAWINLVLNELQGAFYRNRDVVVVGGTGLYVRALFEEYGDMKEPPSLELRNELMDRERKEGLSALVDELLSLDPDTSIDLQNPARVRRAIERWRTPSIKGSFKTPPFRKTKLAIDPSVEVLDKLLRARVTSLWDKGWPEEVEKLLANGVPLSAPAFRAIGYVSVAGFLSGENSRDKTEEDIFRATRQYAKRQRTWLRSEPNLVRLTAQRLGGDDIIQAAHLALELNSVEEPE